MTEQNQSINDGRFQGETEASLRDVVRRLDKIENYHLQHIYTRLNAINQWLIGILVTLVLTLVGVIINLITRS